MNYNEEALKLHEEHKGKIGITSKVPVKTRDDLSTAYTPGVAEPCRKIHADKKDVYRYTAKGNLVAVVTDGTAVLGLGDIGPEAAMPVMEGKAILFKEFGGVDAFPICLDAKLCRPCDCCECEGCCSAPKCICRSFDGDFSVASPEKAVRVTLGLFTIVQLERDVQMLIPAYDFCVPEKECCHDMENDPCDAFKQIRFPVNEFFPPSSSASQQKGDNCGCSGRERENNCGCGCQR